MALALCALAVAAWFYLSRQPTTATVPTSATGYTIEALAINITILQMVMGVVSIVLALLGFFGYTTIKSAAVDAAVKASEDVARKAASDQLRKLEALEQRVQSSLDENPGDYGISDASNLNAEPLENE